MHTEEACSLQDLAEIQATVKEAVVQASSAGEHDVCVALRLQTDPILSLMIKIDPCSNGSLAKSACLLCCPRRHPTSPLLDQTEGRPAKRLLCCWSEGNLRTPKGAAKPTRSEHWPSRAKTPRVRWLMTAVVPSTVTKVQKTLFALKARRRGRLILPYRQGLEPEDAGDRSQTS